MTMPISFTLIYNLQATVRSAFNFICTVDNVTETIFDIRYKRISDGSHTLNGGFATILGV